MTVKSNETKTLTIAQRIAACNDEIAKRENDRVAAIAAKHKSNAKYARHCLRRARALLMTLNAERDAKKTSTTSKTKNVVKTPA